MRLSLTSWSLPYCTLPEVAGIAAALGFEAIDVGYFYRSALDRRRVLVEGERYADELRRLPVAFANLYNLFGADPADRNLADPASHEQNRADLEKALKFCKALSIPSVFILPGVVNPGQSRAQSLAASAEGLKPLVELGEEAGIAVCVEPHVHSYLESPAMTLDLIGRVSGLKLALDYAHFVAIGYRQEEIDMLALHAGHLHLRQARPGVLQAKMEEGTINFAALLGTMRDSGFEGYAAAEYVHQNYMATLYDDVLSETVKMRDVVRSWLKNEEG